MKRRACAVAILSVLCWDPASARSGDELAPYKMVRSLQLLQDRLARGDHAALPMQQKLLQLTDERLRTATSGELADPANLHALFIYAMSGGNPATLESALTRMNLEGDDGAIGTGVLAYMTGNLVRASEALAAIDPMIQSPETGAMLALVKGSIISAKQPEPAIALMDKARLLAPGTLVEEAALRRSMPLALALDDQPRFLRLAEQYTRRFLMSPYASEFADALVEGIVTFDQIGPDQIEAIVSLMSPAQQEAVYLRLARRSTIKGQVARSAFASDRATAISRDTEAGEDPRATLYQAIASITSENIEEVLANLEKVDASDLSPRDRRLLLAARAIAGEVLAPPAALTIEPAQPEDDPAPASPSPEETAVTTPDAEPRMVSLPKVPAEQPVKMTNVSMQPDAAPDVVSRELIDSVRKKLDAVDRMLEEDLSQ